MKTLYRILPALALCLICAPLWAQTDEAPTEPTEPERFTFARGVADEGYPELALDVLAKALKNAKEDEAAWYRAGRLIVRKQIVESELNPVARVDRLHELAEQVNTFNTETGEHPVLSTTRVMAGEMFQLVGKARSEQMEAATDLDEREKFRREAEDAYAKAIDAFESFRTSWDGPLGHESVINAGYFQAITLYFHSQLATPGTAERKLRLRACVDFLSRFEWESEGMIVFYVVSMYKGRALVELGDVKPAVQTFLRVSQLADVPLSAARYRDIILQGWYYAARTQAKIGREQDNTEWLSQAVDTADRASITYPNDHSETMELLQIQKAVALAGLGDEEGAAQLLDGIANTETLAGRKAIDALDQIGTFHHVSDKLLYYIGSRALERGRYTRALAAFEEIYSRKDSDLNEEQRLAVAYRTGLTRNLVHRYEDAVEPLAQLDDHPEHPDADDALRQQMKAVKVLSAREPGNEQWSAAFEILSKRFAARSGGASESDRILLEARVEEEIGNYAAAAETYARITPDHGDAWHKALLGIGLNRLENALHLERGTEPAVIQAELDKGTEALNTYLSIMKELGREIDFGVLSARYLLARIRLSQPEPDPKAALEVVGNVDAYLGRVANEKLAAVLFEAIRAHLMLKEWTAADNLYAIARSQLRQPSAALKAAEAIGWAHEKARETLKEGSDEELNHAEKAAEYFYEVFILHRDIGMEMNLINVNGIGNRLFQLGNAGFGDHYYSLASEVYTELQKRTRKMDTLPEEIGEPWGVTWRLARARALGGDPGSAILLYENLVKQYPSKAFLLLEKAEATERYARELEMSDPKTAKRMFEDTINAYGKIALEADKKSETYWRANYNYYRLMLEVGLYEQAWNGLEQLAWRTDSRFDRDQFGLKIKFMAIQEQLQQILDK